jgi:membrane protein
MNKIKTTTNKVLKFFREEIWDIEMEELSKARARFVKYAKVGIITAKTYAQQKIGPQAVALSYLSVMALVPFLAIVFAITGGLGIDGLLKDFMYSNFSSNQGVIDTVLSFSQNIIDTARSGWMGLLNALLFLWIIYRLMAGVESAFNNVWKVNGNRSLVRRLSYYLLILMLSPFVILVLFSGSFVYTNLLEYMGLNMEELSFIKKLLSWILFVAVASLTFSAMYKFIPKYKVEYGVAFRAAVFAAVVFTGMQFLYLETQLLVTRLNGVYGTFAAIPLFMVWLNISWNIILMGAELSYAFQHVDNYNLDD